MRAKFEINTVAAFFASNWESTELEIAKEVWLKNIKFRGPEQMSEYKTSLLRLFVFNYVGDGHIFGL